MTANELRKKFIDFFRKKDHIEIKSASLVPDNDPTVLFTTAGMHPLVPYIIGQPHPAGNRLVNYQKCIRTGDIDDVGDDVHLTFFEMLGNWSLGDYFKKEAIRYSYEFLTSPDYLNLPKNKLAVSVFAGDMDAPFDEESYDIWRSLGISSSRIAKLGKKDNWWGPAGQSGPCGPDTEMFYWVGDEPAPEVFNPESTLWVEIWNDVFMEYNKTLDGNYEPLTKRNVDTGMGLERVTAVLQQKETVYDTELFTPLFEKLATISQCENPNKNKGARIVVEHLRAATFILAEGISPSNVGQGYVLRRLIRRAIREARKLGVKGDFTIDIAGVVVKKYSDVYPELSKNEAFVREELEREEMQFSKTLEKGIREFNKLVNSIPANINHKVISGRKAFMLYETYGFPLELTKDLALEQGFVVDEAGFEKAYNRHQELSRKGAEQQFKGGLADHSVATTRLHTATHLLHQALRIVLGDHVAQKGSNITAERLRFDFSHPQKMTREELERVEAIVNEQIRKNLEVKKEEMTVADAQSQGAIGLFEERYGERISVYSIGDFSKEICGGPHVNNTNELKTFKISKEESSSKGVRRIKAVLT